MFRYAYESALPLLLKGPTGCGKSRFVEAMAAAVGRPLVTVACNDETTATDLLGRWLVRGGDTVWQDGPVTRAVRSGAILYLDEIAEAREDVIVVLHSLSDYRRELYVDRIDETLQGAARVHDDRELQPGLPAGTQGDEAVDAAALRLARSSAIRRPRSRPRSCCAESGVDPARARRLVTLATKIRTLEELGLAETVSTRLLVGAGTLIRRGLPPRAGVQRGRRPAAHRRPGHGGGAARPRRPRVLSPSMGWEERLFGTAPSDAGGGPPALRVGSGRFGARRDARRARAAAAPARLRAGGGRRRARSRRGRRRRARPSHPAAAGDRPRRDAGAEHAPLPRARGLRGGVGAPRLHASRGGDARRAAGSGRCSPFPRRSPPAAASSRRRGRCSRKSAPTCSPSGRRSPRSRRPTPRSRSSPSSTSVGRRRSSPGACGPSVLAWAQAAAALAPVTMTALRAACERDCAATSGTVALAPVVLWGGLLPAPLESLRGRRQPAGGRAGGRGDGAPGEAPAGAAPGRRSRREDPRRESGRALLREGAHRRGVSRRQEAGRCRGRACRACATRSTSSISVRSCARASGPARSTVPTCCSTAASVISKA